MNRANQFLDKDVFFADNGFLPVLRFSIPQTMTWRRVPGATLACLGITSFQLFCPAIQQVIKVKDVL